MENKMYFLDDYYTIAAQVYSPSASNIAIQADSVPVYYVYERTTSASILSGSLTLNSSTSGFYTGEFQITSANGFDYSTDYTVRVTVIKEGKTGIKLEKFKVKSEAEHKVKKSADTMYIGSVTSAVFTPTVTEFDSDINTATSGLYNYRICIFTQGNLNREVCNIENYYLSGSNGHFKVNRGTGIGLTSAPSHGDTFIIV